MVYWYLDSEKDHYEAFRSTLETIILQGKLKDWVDERLQHDAIWEGNGVPMGPSILPEEKTRYHHDPEPALSAVWYFMLTGCAEEIFDAGIALTRELGTNQERAGKVGYIEQLGSLFFDVVPPREEEASAKYIETHAPRIYAFVDTLLEVLMSKEAPTGLKSRWFGDEVEEKMILLWLDADGEKGIKDKGQVKNWFVKYVKEREYAIYGMTALLFIDYNSGLDNLAACLKTHENSYGAGDELKDTLVKQYTTSLALQAMLHPDGIEAAVQAWRQRLDEPTRLQLVTALRECNLDSEYQEKRTNFLAIIDSNVIS